MKRAAFLTSQTLSLFAEEIIRFALPAAYFLKSGHAYGSSILYCCILIPRIFLGPFLAYLSDRFSPFYIFRIVILGQAFLMGVLPFSLSSMSSPALWIWSILAFALSILNAIQYGAVQSILPLMWDKNHLLRANGLYVSLTSASLFMGPLVAGLLLDQIGFSQLCLIGSCINIAAFFLQYFTPSLLIPQSAPAPSSKGEWMRGWTFVQKNKLLLSNLFLTSPVNFFMSISMALLTPLVLQNSNEKALNLGIILFAGTFGQFLGGMLCKRLGEFLEIKVLLWGGFLISGAFGLALMGFFPTILGLTGGYFLCGIGTAMINTANQTIWQLSCPTEIRSRVASVRRSSNTLFAPAGFLIAIPLSLFFSNLGVTNPYSGSFIFCGSMLVLLGIVGMSLKSMNFEYINEMLKK